MKNKQHFFSLLGVVGQLFRKKHLLLIVPLCVGFLLTGCDREESDRSDAGQVQLLRPVNGLAVNMDETILGIQYDGFAEHQNVEISINGVLCDAPGNNACSLNHNRAYGAATASFVSLASVLQLGENSVTVKNTANGRQATVNFYYDNHEPTIEISRIEVADNGDQLLNHGDTVTITGEIIDPSAIKSVKIWRSDVSTPIYMANATTNVVELQDKIFIIPNEPWPDASSEPAPYFSYEIIDVHDQIGKGKFLVNGAKIGNAQAIQLNNTVFQHIAPIGNKLIDTMLSGLDDLYTSPACGINYDFNGPPSVSYECNPMRYLEDSVDEMFNDSEYNIAASFCAILRGKNANAWPNCVGQLREVGAANKPNILITKPKVMIGGTASSTFDLHLGVAFNAVELPFEITSSNDDRFTSTLELTSFQLYSFFRIEEPSAPGEVVKVTRSPVNLNLSPKFGGNRQAYLRGSYCSGDCSLSAALLEPGYNLRLTPGGREAADGMLNTLVDTLEKKFIAPRFPANTTVTINETSANPAIQQINKVYNRQAHWADKGPRNLHLNYAGRNTAEMPIDPLSLTIENPVLGTLFTGKNSYGPVKDAVFPSGQPGVGGQLIDIAYAISEDSVNQQLTALYQSGQPGFLGGGIGRNVTGVSTTFFDGLSTVCLESQANTPPSVQFAGYYAKKTGFDFSFVGVELINTSKEDIPGNVKLIMNNVNLTARNGSCTGAIVNNAQDINVDIAVRFFVSMENGKPVLKPYDRVDDSFVVVRATKARDSVIAAEFAKVLQEHVQQEMDLFNSDATNNLLMSEIPYLSNVVGSLFVDVYLNANWWAGYGIKFLSFGIEPSGGNFMFTAKVETKTGMRVPGDQSSRCEQNMTDYFRAYCVRK